MGKELLEKLSKWRDQIGYIPSIRKLRDAGLSNSMAEKLLAGTYPNQPKMMYLNAIEKAMKAK